MIGIFGRVWIPIVALFCLWLVHFVNDVDGWDSRSGPVLSRKGPRGLWGGTGVD